MPERLLYGLHLDRDYLVDLTFRMQTSVSIICSLTVYPANLYLLLGEFPSMMREIRAAYLLNIVSLIICDWTLNLLLQPYAFAPYGLIYCEGVLCRMEFSKATLMTAIAIVLMFCIPPFYFVMVRMHQIIIKPTSKLALSWKLQLLINGSLVFLIICNVIGFVLTTHDIENYSNAVQKPELEWLVRRGGVIVLFGEPGEHSSVLYEVMFFGATFSIFLPLLVFLSTHAMYTLKKTTSSAYSMKTQSLTQKQFDVFSFQLRGAIIFFDIPLCFFLFSVVVDARHILPDVGYAFLRFAAVILLSLNSAQFAFVFILRNSTHREILTARFRRSIVFGLIRRVLSKNGATTVEMSTRSIPSGTSITI